MPSWTSVARHPQPAQEAVVARPSGAGSPRRTRGARRRAAGAGRPGPRCARAATRPRAQPAASATNVDALARRVAVISDIHANWHALEAVLDGDRARAARRALVSRRPRRLRAAAEPCCAAVERRAAICLAGNHDLGVLGELDLDEFSRDAVAAARWTAACLPTSSRAYLRVAAADGATSTASSSSTRARATRSGSTCSRAERRAAALELTEGAARARRPQPRPAWRSLLEDGALDGGLAPEGTEADLGAGRRLLNPGLGRPAAGRRPARRLAAARLRGRSVPRSGAVEYPVERTQAEIRERGLPDALAERLARGL